MFSVSFNISFKMLFSFCSVSWKSLHSIPFVEAPFFFCDKATSPQSSLNKTYRIVIGCGFLFVLPFSAAFDSKNLVWNFGSQVTWRFVHPAFSDDKHSLAVSFYLNPNPQRECSLINCKRKHVIKFQFLVNKHSHAIILRKRARHLADYLLLN